MIFAKIGQLVKQKPEVVVESSGEVE